MAKKMKAMIKLQLEAGKANPSPPVGPALGQHGVNIMEFCKRFNSASEGKGETVVPVIIKVYEDRTFDFEMKTSPAAVLIKKALGIKKGSSNSLNQKVGELGEEDFERIAKEKMEDLNADSVDSAIKIIKGTARSMGVKVKG